MLLRKWGGGGGGEFGSITSNVSLFSCMLVVIFHKIAFRNKKKYLKNKILKTKQFVLQRFWCVFCDATNRIITHTVL